MKSDHPASHSFPSPALESKSKSLKENSVQTRTHTDPVSALLLNVWGSSWPQVRLCRFVYAVRFVPLRSSFRCLVRPRRPEAGCLEQQRVNSPLDPRAQDWFQRPLETSPVESLLALKPAVVPSTPAWLSRGLFAGASSQEAGGGLSQAGCSPGSGTQQRKFHPNSWPPLPTTF